MCVYVYIRRHKKVCAHLPLYLYCNRIRPILKKAIGAQTRTPLARLAAPLTAIRCGRQAKPAEHAAIRPPENPPAPTRKQKKRTAMQTAEKKTSR